MRNDISKKRLSLDVHEVYRNHSSVSVQDIHRLSQNSQWDVANRAAVAPLRHSGLSYSTDTNALNSDKSNLLSSLNERTITDDEQRHCSASIPLTDPTTKGELINSSMPREEKTSSFQPSRKSQNYANRLPPLMSMHRKVNSANLVSIDLQQCEKK